MVFINELKLDHDIVNSILEYNEVNGKLYNKFRRSQSHKEGMEAGTLDGQTGYIRVNVCKSRILAHRLIWFMTYNRWPNDILDHIDGNRSNNLISNLRECTRQQNSYNRKLNVNSKTGFKGVEFVRGRKVNHSDMYKASISFQGKEYLLGFFSTIEEAFLVRQAAETELYGQFSRKEKKE